MEFIEDSVSQLAESPFWHPEQQALYWCDIKGRAIRRYREGFPVQHWPVPSEPGCAAPVRGGGLVIAMRDGTYLFDEQTGGADKVLDCPYDPALYRFNDGRCDGAGRLLAGSLNEQKTAADAELYSIVRSASGWRQSRLANGVMTANGLAFSPDKRVAYWADTAAHRVDCFDYDLAGGELSNRRCFIQFEVKPADGSLRGYGGRPDGAAVDEAGCYWLAMYEGASILCVLPDGSIAQRYPVPVQCPTMVCFGGADRRTLFVTSARAGRPAAELGEQPGAGGVFSMRVTTPGLPVDYFY
ncbi:MAG: SMP-30/gluconolactonase/LRE family protein [Burkholderiaceae bacterium]